MINTHRKKHIFHNYYYGLIYCLIVGLISVILGQDITWDLRNYHFYNPYMLLNSRLDYDVAPAAIQTFLNPLIDVPFFVAVYHLHIPPVFIGFIVGATHGINTYFVHNIVYFSLKELSNFYRNIFSILAAIISIFGAGFLSVLGTTSGDDTVSIFVLGSILILSYSLYYNENLKWRTIALSGFILGLGAGLKLTAIVYPIALAASLLFVLYNLKQKISSILILVGGVLVGFFLTAGYWMIEMWKHYSNPFFPFFNSIFQSPYAVLSSWRDTRFFPRDIWQTLFYPFYFINQKKPYFGFEAGFSDIRLAICYILIVLFIIVFTIQFIRHRNIYPSVNNSRFIFIIVPFFTISYIVWQQMFSIYRYAIPLELLSPVLVINIVNYVLRSEKKILLICLLIFTLMIATVKPFPYFMGRIYNRKITASYFGIDSNNLAKYSDKTIFMYGWEGISYFIPYFPSETRFVKHGIGTFENTAMEKKVVDILKSHESSLYLMSLDNSNPGKMTTSDKEKMELFLKQINLQVDYKDCQFISSNVDKLSICKIKKTSSE